MADTYDSDDAANRSPPLKPQKIDYGLVPTPRPYIPSRSASPQQSPSGPSCKSPHQRRKYHQPSRGDELLISSIDPNRPDIAAAAREQRLGEETETGKIDGEKETATIAKDALSLIPPDELAPESSLSLEQTHIKPEQSTEDDDLSMFDGEGRAGDTSEQPQQWKDRDAKTPKAEHESPKTDTDLRQRNASPDITFRNESIATSPELRKYTISQSDRPSGQALPRIQPLPQSISPKPTDTTSQNLPSLQSTLGTQLKEAPVNDKIGVTNGPSQNLYQSAPASSPPEQHSSLVRPESQLPGQYGPPQISPAPYSQESPASSAGVSSLSPPSRSGNPSYWRAPAKSEGSYVTSPYDPSSVGSQIGNSPSTGYPTPSDNMAAADAERLNLVNAPLQPNGPLTSSGFKCTHPGCESPPFQTQYLLK
jgi:hypothetical protein